MNKPAIRRVYFSKAHSEFYFCATHVNASFLGAYRSCTVALPLKGNEFQANHNWSWHQPSPARTVALPLKGNEFQANHNSSSASFSGPLTVALPLKGNEFQANHNCPFCLYYCKALLLYLSKVTNFKQITTNFIVY